MLMPPPESPDWILALWDECERTSQAACARKLEVCAATVNLVLKGTYPAKTDRFEAKVRAVLMTAVHPCPVLGELSAAKCRDEQSAPYYPDPIRASLHRACPSCAFFQNRKGNQ